MKLWQEGRRKLVYGLLSFGALVSFAFVHGATFESFATAIEFWLGTMLAAHVTQERLMKPATPGAPTT